MELGHNIELVCWRKTCCVLRPFHVRHCLYTDCPYAYGKGHAAHTADDDDDSDVDGIDGDVDG